MTVNYQSRLHTNSEELMVEIRIEQNPQEPVIPDGHIIYVYGQFHLSDTQEMQIEAIHIFPYPASVTAEILKMFPARIEVVGYVFQESQVLPDSTKVIFVNAMVDVRDHFHVQSLIGAIVGNDRWPISPPTPQLYSPIRIKGYLDCIDLFSLAPVITVEHLTLEVGIARTFNGRPGVKDLPKSLITIDPDFSWKYAESTVSKGSVLPYHTAYPKPVGFLTSQLSYSAPRYPAPFTKKAPIVDKIPTGNTDVKASSETYSPDPVCKQPNGVDEARPSNPDVLDNNSVYHEDILTSDEISHEQQRQETHSKPGKCYTPPISPPRTRLRHRKRSDKFTKLPSSQRTLS
ncbi:hypothetical protein M422DRAFT_249503 [Sphaerobolus stellatus SS14]|uniref:Unplaced genomic scaffold SPHSTscaffold_30, whole genome shotgun sequence n=1 Tax=Sphaerobolus stellatus (strain SS14) TaxID=990650 RepID=A0A0C9W4Z7_SPHS4|nr:hypothetical protein M422DRAFT_249503 [Sphaerobolus stellatus SS14]